MVTSLRLCPASPDTVVLPRAARWILPASAEALQQARSTSAAGVTTSAATASSSAASLRFGTGYGHPDYEPPSFSPSALASLPALPSFLSAISSYTFHSDEALPPYEPTHAPWYELELDASGPAAGYRLVVQEAEWMLRSHPWRQGALGSNAPREESGRNPPVVDGVSLLVVLYPTAALLAKQHKSFLDVFYANHSLAMQLLSGLQCGFTAQTRQQAVAAIGSEEAARADAVAAAINGAVPREVRVFSHPLWEGYTHYLLHCPFPHSVSAFDSRLLTHQQAAGPPLALTELSIYQPSLQQAASFGFSSLAVPLCLLRMRRVRTAVVLHSLLGPPHQLRVHHLHSFLAYYLFLGVQLFLIPDRYGSLLPSLLPYLRLGVVLYYHQPFLSPYHQPYLDQTPLLYAQVMRLRLVAEWLLNVDMDEYVGSDHPYYSENEDVVVGPDDACWRERPQPGAPEAEDRRDGRLPDFFRCRSMLDSLLSLPGSDRLSVLTLANVPHWSLARRINRTLSRPPSPSSPVSIAAIAAMHPLDVWPHRSHSAEYHRFKCLFRPHHVHTLNQHDVTLNPVAAEARRVGEKVEAWHKFMGDAGIQRHKDLVIGQAVLERAGSEEEEEEGEDEESQLQAGAMSKEEWRYSSNEHVSWHPALQLSALLCNRSEERAQLLSLTFNLSCCLQPDAANLCFCQHPSFSPYVLATLTPLFPTVSQSDPYSPKHPALPLPLPLNTFPHPLALFSLHVAHLFCLHLPVGQYLRCHPSLMTWKHRGAMWGEGRTQGIAFTPEESEERSRVLVRQRMLQWLRAQSWSREADMLWSPP